MIQSDATVIHIPKSVCATIASVLQAFSPAFPSSSRFFTPLILIFLWVGTTDKLLAPFVCADVRFLTVTSNCEREVHIVCATPAERDEQEL